MPTRQQIRASAHAQRRRRQPEPAEIVPEIVKGRGQNRRFLHAAFAYETGMAALFRARQDIIDAARADCQRIIAAAEAEYDRGHEALVAAYAQDTADSHQPETDEADGPNEPDETDEEATS